jgi:acid stress-induced BolA-like protein IbaG/YrbA
MKEVIEKIICENIPDARCIFDGDACNFRLVVVSSIFIEMSLVDQYKKVMKLLESQFKSGELHALSLETRVS